jgi:uncharacterized protein (TIGR02391 family)
MYHSLSSLVPNAADLLALEIEELAGVLLIHLNSYEGVTGNSIYQNGRISQNNFIATQNSTGYGQKPEYGERQPEVNLALMEAWAWLESEVFLIRDPSQPAAWFFISRRGQRLRSRDEFEAFQKASLLPKGQLHALIAAEVYPAFLRGKYDTAIFEAFREVEIAVREAGNFGPNDHGVKLMRAAFKPSEKNGQPSTPGPLADTQLPVAEQEAMANLFTGAIGFYKNPQSHRHVPTHAQEAAEVIVFASQLLRIVDLVKG